jgi:UDP-glucose 4-epimerase
MSNPIRTSISGSRVLVTGGAGFIGSHLVEQLAQADNRVTVIDNLTTGSLVNLARVHTQLTMVSSDLGTQLQAGTLVLDDYDYIFHLAGNAYIPSSVENSLFDFQINLQYTLLLLEALRQTTRRPRLIFTSSAAVYGNPARLPISEEDPTIPISPYGVGKLAAERYVSVYSKLYGVRATSLRLFSIYGPRQHKQVIYDLLCKLHANPSRIEVLGDGSQERDFTYVDDAVQALILTATHAPGRGEVYNVASGTAHTIADLIGCWCEICGLRPQLIYTGMIRPGDADKWRVDITRLSALGYQAATALPQGLTIIKDWYDETRR